jgi:hypothetical protein
VNAIATKVIQKSRQGIQKVGLKRAESGIEAYINKGKVTSSEQLYKQKFERRE